MPFQYPRKQQIAPVGWGFTFIGEGSKSATESVQNRPEHKQPEPSLAPQQSVTSPASSADKAGTTFPLSMVAIGEAVEVVGFSGGQKFSHRLTSMGIFAGAIVRVISRTDSGSVVLAIQDSRLGLGAGMAHKVRVAPHNPQSSEPSKY